MTYKVKRVYFDSSSDVWLVGVGSDDYASGKVFEGATEEEALDRAQTFCDETNNAPYLQGTLNMFARIRMLESELETWQRLARDYVEAADAVKAEVKHGTYPSEAHVELTEVSKALMAHVRKVGEG